MRIIRFGRRLTIAEEQQLELPLGDVAPAKTPQDALIHSQKALQQVQMLMELEDPLKQLKGGVDAIDKILGTSIGGEVEGMINRSLVSGSLKIGELREAKEFIPTVALILDGNSLISQYNTLLTSITSMQQTVTGK